MDLKIPGWGFFVYKQLMNKAYSYDMIKLP